MTVLLKDAMQPNLVQERWKTILPFVHGGPFAISPRLAKLLVIATTNRAENWQITW